MLPTISHNHLSRFFLIARERYHIMLKKRRGDPKPWTDDKVFQAWRFCNVFREDDATTIWFRENIRGPLAEDPKVIMATIAFRWFNRITTGEVLLPHLRDEAAQDWDLEAWRKKLTIRRAAGHPIVTAAYMVKTPPVLNKIDGILQELSKAILREGELHAYLGKKGSPTMQGLWEILRDFSYIGDFTANEVVVDLSHTYALRNATDKMTWTNPGPGATGGIGTLLHCNIKAYDRFSPEDRKAMMSIMQVFLKASKDPIYWRQDWPEWTLHTVQFWFCEFLKYSKGRRGLRLKRRYDGTTTDATTPEHLHA